MTYTPPLAGQRSHARRMQENEKDAEAFAAFCKWIYPEYVKREVRRRNYGLQPARDLLSGRESYRRYILAEPPMDSTTRMADDEEIWRAEEAREIEKMQEVSTVRYMETPCPRPWWRFATSPLAIKLLYRLEKR